MNPYTSLGILTVCCISLLLIGKMLFQQLWNVLILRALPSPQGPPILGAIDLMNSTPEERFWKYRQYAKELRPAYKLSICHFVWVNIVTAPDVQQILTSSHLKKGDIYSCLKGWLGSGLLVNNVGNWHPRRKLMDPTFQSNILPNYMAVFNEETSKLIQGILTNLDDSGIDITKYIDRFTLDNASETAMGLEMCDEGILIDFRQNMSKMTAILIEKMKNYWYHIDYIYKWSKLAYEEQKTTQSLHRFADTVVRRRKVMRRGSTIERTNLATLDLLLKYREDGADINDEGIRDEINTLLVSGHDTVTMALCMLILLLANNKPIQDKVIKEIETVLGKKSRHVTLDDLSKLNYLECCIKETLRLYPAVPWIGRIANEDFTTSTGFKIPKGINLVIHIYDLHRDATVFPNPEKFDPERFKPGNVENRPPFSYIPFSAGSRNCIGEKCAMLQMKTAICGLLQCFYLEPIDTPVDIKFYNDFILRTNSPIRVKFIKK